MGEIELFYHLLSIISQIELFNHLLYLKLKLCANKRLILDGKKLKPLNSVETNNVE